MTTCAICQRERQFIFSLPISIDDNPDNVEIKKVCGDCWEIIAEIARRVDSPTTERLCATEKKVAQLERQLAENLVRTENIIVVLSEKFPSIAVAIGAGSEIEKLTPTI